MCEFCGNTYFRLGHLCYPEHRAGYPHLPRTHIPDDMEIQEVD